MDELVKTMFLPSSPSHAPDLAWMCPLGMPELQRRAPQGAELLMAAAAMTAPLKTMWPGVLSAELLAA